MLAARRTLATGQRVVQTPTAGTPVTGVNAERVRKVSSRAGLPQGLADEGGGELLEVTAGGVGELAQGPLPGEHRQPVHRGPDGVLDPGAAPPAEHAGVDHLVEYRAELVQGQEVRPGPALGSVVTVLTGHGERGGEQPWFLASELQVRAADRA